MRSWSNVRYPMICALIKKHNLSSSWLFVSFLSLSWGLNKEENIETQTEMHTAYKHTGIRWKLSPQLTLGFPVSRTGRHECTYNLLWQLKGIKMLTKLNWMPFKISKVEDRLRLSKRSTETTCSLLAFRNFQWSALRDGARTGNIILIHQDRQCSCYCILSLCIYYIPLWKVCTISPLSFFFLFLLRSHLCTPATKPLTWFGYMMKLCGVPWLQSAQVPSTIKSLYSLGIWNTQLLMLWIKISSTQ